jgi:hypothetical protein
MFNTLLKSRLYPDKLQWMVTLFLLPTVVFLLFGPAEQENPANLLVWMFWWPMLCVLFLIAGRIWCSLCPFALVGRLVQRAAGLQRAVPDFFKQYGSWLILMALFLLFWFEEMDGVVVSPRGTAVVLLSILSGAVIFGLFFRGRTWCRYVCPLGGISLIYARAAFFKVRSKEAACAECLTKDCVVPDDTYAGCPMSLTPFAIDSVSDCSFCGSCVKRCTNQSMRVSLETPSLDLSGQSSVAPAVVWLVILLAGHLVFLNILGSKNLPISSFVHHAVSPVFLKTALLFSSMVVCYFLFEACVRLAKGNNADVTRTQLLRLGALPLIPLLLFSHLGHLSLQIWAHCGQLFSFLAGITGLPWLRVDLLLPMAWTAYFNSLSIFLGLVMTLWVLRWALKSEAVLPVRRVGWVFGMMYAIYGSWNIFATWPARATILNENIPPAVLGPQNGWEILWPFIAVNAALLILALIVKHSERQTLSAAKHVEFSAGKSWEIHDRSGARQVEVLEWLLEQAVLAKWRIPAVVGLANATNEIVTFLQRTLADGSAITVNATLRKNKGVMTIFHEGRPLTLPDYKPVSNLDDIDDSALQGLELRLAVAQVEQMHYQARLSDARCCFTLRQAL